MLLLEYRKRRHERIHAKISSCDNKKCPFQLFFLRYKVFFHSAQNSNNDNNNNNGYDKNSQERFEWELCCYTCSRQHNGLEIIWELFCKLLCYLHHRCILSRISDLSCYYYFIVETSIQIFHCIK